MRIKRLLCRLRGGHQWRCGWRNHWPEQSSTFSYLVCTRCGDEGWQMEMTR